MNKNKKHLARTKSGLVILDEGIAPKRGMIVLGQLSRNIDGSFESGLSCVEEDGNKYYFHSFEVAREIALNKIRIMRDLKLKENDTKFLIALKNDDKFSKEKILSECKLLRDLPEVAQSALEKLVDLDLIREFIPNI